LEREREREREKDGKGAKTKNFWRIRYKQVAMTSEESKEEERGKLNDLSESELKRKLKCF